MIVEMNGSISQTLFHVTIFSKLELNGIQLVRIKRKYISAIIWVYFGCQGTFEQQGSAIVNDLKFALWCTAYQWEH